MKKKILSIFVVLACIFALPVAAQEVVPISREQAIQITRQYLVEQGVNVSKFDISSPTFDAGRGWFIAFMQNETEILGGDHFVKVSPDGREITSY